MGGADRVFFKGCFLTTSMALPVVIRIVLKSVHRKVCRRTVVTANSRTSLVGEYNLQIHKLLLVHSSLSAAAAQPSQVSTVTMTKVEIVDGSNFASLNI